MLTLSLACLGTVFIIRLIEFGKIFFEDDDDQSRSVVLHPMFGTTFGVTLYEREPAETAEKIIALLKEHPLFCMRLDNELACKVFQLYGRRKTATIVLDGERSEGLPCGCKPPFW